MGNESAQILEYLRQLYQLVVTLEQTIETLEQAINNIKTLTDVQSWIASRSDKAIDKLEAQPPIDDVLRELSDYLTSNIDRVDRMLLLILEKMPEGRYSERIKQETAELRRETIDNRIRSLKLQLRQHTENLNSLEEQAAMYGMAIPQEIKNQIDWEKKKIGNIKEEMEYLKS